MYASDHNPPHFYAALNDREALFDIMNGDSLRAIFHPKKPALCWHGMRFIEMNC